jgi:hypothetical protein
MAANANVVARRTHLPALQSNAPLCHTRIDSPSGTKQVPIECRSHRQRPHSMLGARGQNGELLAENGLSVAHRQRLFILLVAEEASVSPSRASKAMRPLLLSPPIGFRFAGSFTDIHPNRPTEPLMQSPIAAGWTKSTVVTSPSRPVTPHR